MYVHIKQKPNSNIHLGLDISILSTEFQEFQQNYREMGVTTSPKAFPFNLNVSTSGFKFYCRLKFTLFIEHIASRYQIYTK